MNGRASKTAARGEEPTYTSGVPPAPAWLSKQALAEYSRLAPLLEQQGILTQVDYAAFLEYCDTFGRLERVRAAINDRKFKFLLRGRENPLLTQERKLSEKLKTYLHAFGLTPESRARAPRPPAPPGANGGAPSPPGLTGLFDFDDIEATLSGRKPVN